jgi:hypothetical protein
MAGRGRCEDEWAELGWKHQVGYGANWAGKENFPGKQVRLQGTFGPKSDRVAEKNRKLFSN